MSLIAPTRDFFATSDLKPVDSWHHVVLFSNSSRAAFEKGLDFSPLLAIAVLIHANKSSSMVELVSNEAKYCKQYDGEA